MGTFDGRYPHGRRRSAAGFAPISSTSDSMVRSTGSASRAKSSGWLSFTARKPDSLIGCAAREESDVLGGVAREDAGKPVRLIRPYLRIEYLRTNGWSG